MTYAGSWIPTDTDVYQPALPEKNPAWEERNCSGPKPWNALNNSKKPQCRGHRVNHSLYSALPGGSIPPRVPTPWLQSTSVQGGRLVKAAHRLAIRKQGLWLTSCPDAGGEKAEQSLSPYSFSAPLLTILRTWLSALPSLPLQFSTWYGGVITTSSMTTMFFSCHLQSLMLEGKESRWKLPIARHSTLPAWWVTNSRKLTPSS